MKIGEVFPMGNLLAFSDEKVEVMIDRVSDAGMSGEGDLTLLGVKLGRATLAQKPDGSVEVLNVV